MNDLTDFPSKTQGHQVLLTLIELSVAANFSRLSLRTLFPEENNDEIIPESRCRDSCLCGQRLSVAAGEKKQRTWPHLCTRKWTCYLCSPVQDSCAWLWAGAYCFQNSVAFHKYHRKQLLNSKEQTFHMCSKGGWAGTAVAHRSAGRGCAGVRGRFVCLTQQLHVFFS